MKTIKRNQMGPTELKDIIEITSHLNSFKSRLDKTKENITKLKFMSE